MKKFLLSFFLTPLVINSFGQIYGFQTPDLNKIDSAWYGQNQITYGDTNYTDGIYTFQVKYDTNSWGGSWSGMAISSFTNDSTPGFTNQYSSITGGGATNSSQYGVFYNTTKIIFSSPQKIQSIDVTNTTYAYLSMKNGDSFAKKFGTDTLPNGSDTTYTGEEVTGKDWFLLTIYSLNNQGKKTGDSINFYLADFRFDNENEDYIIKEWKTVNLNSLGSIYGLTFKLTSSDVGKYGMNTPNYFAIDNIKRTLGIQDQIIKNIKIYPNPSNGMIYFENNDFEEIQIFGMNGKTVYQSKIFNGSNSLNLSNLEKGIYTVKFISQDKFNTSQIVIK